MYPDIAVSSWTFNKLLTSNAQDPEITLYDIPGLLARHGFKAAEICNFHITSTDMPSLRLLRVALENAGVRLVRGLRQPASFAMYLAALAYTLTSY